MSFKLKLFTLFVLFSFLFNEKITFSSSNPFSFQDIILNLENLENQDVFGKLVLPNTSSDQLFPLVIGVAGSLGWRDHHFEQLEIYREMGIATFELNSFNSRNVKSTVGEQTQVTTAMLVLDAYRALDILSEHPNIDREKIAITGWSLGGGTTLFSSWSPLIDAINPNNNFAAHLSYYPPCVIKPQVLEFTKAPMHILIGEIDDWTPASACEEFVEVMQNEGYDVDITVYENSHHSFDSSQELKYIENGYSLTDCMFELREDGAVLMNFLNIPMTSPFLQKIGLGFCSSRGTTIGGNPITKEKAKNFSISFMEKHLLDE